MRVYSYVILTLQSTCAFLLIAYLLYVVLILQSVCDLCFIESAYVCGSDIVMCLCSMFY